jgi:hypothetical protein
VSEVREESCGNRRSTPGERTKHQFALVALSGSVTERAREMQIAMGLGFGNGTVK